MKMSQTEKYRRRVRKLEAENDALEDALVGMVWQHCLDAWPVPEDKRGEEHLGSGCLSANADAIALLIDRGVLVQIGDAVGRAIEAKAAKDSEEETSQNETQQKEPQ